LRLIAIFASTVNGMIALSENDRTEWTSREDKRYFKELTTSVGTIIMGRRTYESIGRTLPGRLNVVLTRNPTAYEESESLIFRSSSPEALIEEIEEWGIDQACLIGGARTFADFADRGLVNEIHITLEPTIRNGVTHLATHLKKPVLLALRGIVSLGPSVVMIYDVK